MTEQEWQACTDPRAMYLEYNATSTERQARLYAVACCRRIWHLLVDERSRLAVRTAERLADGEATSEERQAVYAAARAANREAEAKANARVQAPGMVDFDNAAEATCAAASSAQYSCERSEPPHIRESIWHAGSAAAYAVAFLTAAKVGCSLKGDPAQRARRAEHAIQVPLLRDILGNPFRPVVVAPESLTPAVVDLAKAFYVDGRFDRLADLADRVEATGFGQKEVLAHLRSPDAHIRGCWAVDLLLNKFQFVGSAGTPADRLPD
jgi:hypothetical protein